MVRIFVLVFFVMVTSLVYSQVNSSDITGLWTTCNEDGLYYKSDTITFYQDINHRTYQEDPCCNDVNWLIGKRGKLRVEELFLCTEPGRIKYRNEKETIKLTCKKVQKITLKRRGRKIERFVILNIENFEINRYPHNIKVMTLKRL